MIYGVFGLYGRTGTYWMRDLLGSQGITSAPENDFPNLVSGDIESLRGIGKDVVFRTARPYNIHKMAEHSDTRVIIMLRDPRDIAEAMVASFDKDLLETASTMEQAFESLVQQAHVLRNTGIPYIEVWYEYVEAQWPEICAFIGRPLDTPFPRLPVRGATRARVAGEPIDFTKTLHREDVQSMQGLWQHSWKVITHERFKKRCPLLMKFFETNEQLSMTLEQVSMSGWA